MDLRVREREREREQEFENRIRNREKGGKKDGKFFPPANDETTMEKWTVRRATMKITDRGNGMKL